MAYASGKYAKFISDRSGMEYPYNEMVVEWNGARVHKSEFEPKTPQDRPNKHMPDAISLQYPRPAREEPATERLLPRNAFTHPAGESFIRVFEPGHRRSTGDTVRFRNVTSAGTSFDVTNQVDTANSATGNTITKIDDDFYSFSFGVAPVTDLIFGGKLASAGPVTVSN
jgi:hypothetical protein